MSSRINAGVYARIFRLGGKGRIRKSSFDDTERLERICHDAFNQYAQPSVEADETPFIGLPIESSRLPRWKRLALRSPRQQTASPLATSLDLCDDSAHTLRSKWLRLLPRLFQNDSRGFPSNTVRVFDDSSKCIESILSTIRLARSRVWVESYCLDDSPVGRAVSESLIEAAGRGVDVVVSVDAVGSFGVSSSLRHELRNAGGKLVIFNPIWRPIGPWVYRNHRKLLIADSVAFCGSMNFDWRSARMSERSNSTTSEPLLKTGVIHAPPRWSLNTLINVVFRDMSATRPPDLNLHVGLAGPVVSQLAESFARKLQENRLPLRRDPKLKVSTEPELRAAVFTESPEASAESDVVSNVLVQVLENDGGRQTDTYRKALTTAIASASHSLTVASSYFHPPGSLRRALGRTMREGVPSVLALSGLSDVPFDSRASLAILPYFLLGKKNACRAFFIRRQHCHMKAVIVDSIYSTIGSFNFDR